MVDETGQNDPAFGDGGVVLIDSSDASRTFWPKAAAVAPNGDMIFLGLRQDTGAWELLRLDSDGQPVPSFGDRGDGFAEPALTTALMGVDADGRIVLAGGTQHAYPRGCEGPTRLQRLLANGQPDAGFGSDGIVEIPDLAICGGAVIFGTRTDGSVVVGGGNAIVAVNSAGDIDLAFGAGGRLYPPESVWRAGFLLPDERILVYYSIHHPTGIEVGNLQKECKSDLDCDADVDGTDAAMFKEDYGRRNCSKNNPCFGYFTSDGDVDGTDVFTFRSECGTIVR